MKRVVNAYTNTIHRGPAESPRKRTNCGALRHVPPQHVEVVDTDDESLGDATHCGRCFEGEGGY